MTRSAVASFPAGGKGITLLPLHSCSHDQKANRGRRNQSPIQDVRSRVLLCLLLHLATTPKTATIPREKTPILIGSFSPRPKGCETVPLGLGVHEYSRLTRRCLYNRLGVLSYAFRGHRSPHSLNKMITWDSRWSGARLGCGVKTNEIDIKQSCKALAILSDTVSKILTIIGQPSAGLSWQNQEACSNYVAQSSLQESGSLHAYTVVDPVRCLS